MNKRQRLDNEGKSASKSIDGKNQNNVNQNDMPNYDELSPKSQMIRKARTEYEEK